MGISSTVPQPQAPTGVSPPDPASRYRPKTPSSIILSPNIQNGSTSMMLTQVQNTSRAPGLS